MKLTMRAPFVGGNQDRYDIGGRHTLCKQAKSARAERRVDQRLRGQGADAAKRKEMMKDIESILQDSGIIVQPFWRSLYRHAKPYVKGMEIHPTYEIQVDQAWLDK